jgi:hypothetical protein
MKTNLLLLLILPFLLLKSTALSAQSPDRVYVDQQGVLRWKQKDQEAAFFGVNYTVPFAYGYRSHQALGIDHEKAIDQDVYHLARLGCDAFRVHVWDTEITDSVGNLLENEHLRLFDYLIARLKERNIKIFLTPIAFWGPGYPEKDYPTPGFSSLYNKQRALVEEKAIKAQENYVTQLLRHVNPYTRLTYGNDDDIIAAEVNNEPHHSGLKDKTTAYVNRMVRAFRNTGWTKPIFYNISESPRYADAVAKANIDGVSFQWYPTGLVANRTLQGNYLPHVDRYHIPFDTIPQFAGKARMVYEFDAGDVLASYMYPAIARSFRAAGFQWATQFAYDPLATAYANTEYQTHYLNLAYTPAKAISLLIASKAFHKLPRLKTYGTYPADSVFDVFRVSYRESLSEMNAPEEFYHSNSTRTRPSNVRRLQHIAGVGSSPVVQYQGRGAYFLDKLENGVWRLEVMPDAIPIRDPFAKASPDKEVSRIEWQTHPMQINLPELRGNFRVRGLNEGNTYAVEATGGGFSIQPGAYLLVRKGKEKNRWSATSRSGVIGLGEFVAPKPLHLDPFVVHEPYAEFSAGKPFVLSAQIVGIDATAKVSLQLNSLSGHYQTIPMEQVAAYTYHAEVPADLAVPGLLQYRIIIQKANDEYVTFPGNHKGNPYAWDYYHNEMWQTFVASGRGKLQIFNATHDRNFPIYPNLWRSDERQFLTAEQSGQLIFRIAVKELTGEHVMGWQHFFADKLKGRQSELTSFTKLVVRGRTANAEPVKVKVALLGKDASSYASYVLFTNILQNIEIPLNSLRQDSLLLLPRPYPGFQPFWFKAGNRTGFDLTQAEKLEILVGPALSPADSDKPYSLEVESVWLEK